MMERIIFIPLLTAFLSVTQVASQAQQSKADSLASVLDKYPTNDTVKVVLMTDLAKMLAYSDPSKAMSIIDNELPLAQQLHFTSGILYGYNVKCSLFFIQGNIKEALKVGEQYLQLGQQSHNPSALIAAYGLMGIIYSQSGDDAKALEYLLDGLKIAETSGDKYKIAAITQNIGNIYNDLEDYDKAIDYYKRSIVMSAAVMPGNAVPPSLFNNIGSVLIRKKAYNEALEYLEKGRTISLESNNKRSLAGALTNLSDAYHHLGDNDRSFDFGNQALSVSRMIGDKRTMANSQINIAVAMVDVSDKTLQAGGIDPSDRFSSATHLLDSAIQLSREVGDIVTRDEAYKDLSDISEKQKDYPLSIASMRLYTELHDTIVSNDKQKEITRKFIQYEFDKKEAEIKLQEQVTEGRLKEQELLSLQAHQQLKINQNDLALSNKDRDLQRLTAQKEQEDFLKEKQEKENIQALSEQKDKINNLEIANQKKFRIGLIAGLILLSVIGVLIYRQSILRKTANEELTVINSQLDEANKVKARFFGVLSHDLRSPIARLINFLYLQKEAPELMGDTAADQQQKIVQSAEDLLATIEELLLWSKGQMANFKPEIKPVPVDQLFADLKGLYPGTSRLSIDFILSPSMVINTDKNYLYTILRNLTSNAIKVLEPKADGKITWTAFESEGKKFLSITDNGPGISDAQQKVLFQDNASIGTKNGLGLNFVRDFANAIHCTIQLTSTPGVGSTFTLGVS